MYGVPHCNTVSGGTRIMGGLVSCAVNDWVEVSIVMKGATEANRLLEQTIRMIARYFRFDDKWFSTVDVFWYSS